MSGTLKKFNSNAEGKINQQNPLISVIIPAYNQGHYLRQAVDSVLEQTYQHFQVVIVDDGSTDNTRQVALSFDDPRVQYVFQKNGGLSAARNKGIQHATGQLILFLDSDDLLSSDAIERHLQVRNEHPQVGLSVGGWISVDESGNAKGKPHVPPTQVTFESLVMGQRFPVHAALLDAKWLSVTGDFDESLRAVEDWDLWLRFCMGGGTAVTFQEPICAYRTHMAQMTREPDRMRKALFTVLDKTFQEPNMALEHRELSGAAYSWGHLWSSARAFHHAVELSQARSDLEEAIRLNPDLLEDNASLLTKYLVGWSDSPNSREPLAYLERVYGNLPENVPQLKKRWRYELSNAAISRAFETYRRNEFLEARSFILYAVKLLPNWLCNRGVISILARSYLRS